jgi:hypothetical protein
MITFFNMQNNNKAVKEANKIVLDSITINQKIFVPMLAAPFDIQSSLQYDGLTDQKLQEFLDKPERLFF